MLKAQRKGDLWFQSLSSHGTVQAHHSVGSEAKEPWVSGQTWELSFLSRNRNCNSACFISRLKKKSGGQFFPNVLKSCLRCVSMKINFVQ